MSDKPDYSGKYHPSAADKVQFAIIGGVGGGVGLATYSIATGIGAALIAAIVCVGLGIGEE